MLRFNKKRKTAEKQEKNSKKQLDLLREKRYHEPAKSKKRIQPNDGTRTRQARRPPPYKGRTHGRRPEKRKEKSKAMLPPDRRTARKTFCSPRPETDAKNAHIAHIQPFNGSHQAGTLPARQHGMSTAPADGAAARRSRLDWRLTV